MFRLRPCLDADLDDWCKMGISLTPGQALSLWRDVNLGLVLDEAPDLSIRQTAILLTVYLETPPHTVRGLAAKLAVSKPVITRALDSMGQLGFVSRRRDENDKRNVLIQRTVNGALYLEKLGDMITDKAMHLGE